MTIAVIIARGGSKRLPRKNVRPFCGHPLVAWAIIQASCSKLIDAVYVSTDDDEIEAIAKHYGAKVIRRPDWPDADKVAANRVFLHAIQVLRMEYGERFTELVTMLPTTPLVRPDELDKAIVLYTAMGADQLRPLIPHREFVALKKIHPFMARNVIFDKFYNYYSESNGWQIQSPNWYQSFVGNMFSDLDADIDRTARDDLQSMPTECYFTENEYWQYADVDTAEEFEFAEILMEHYILKGRGIQVYLDYASSADDEDALYRAAIIGKGNNEAGYLVSAGNLSQLTVDKEE